MRGGPWAEKAPAQKVIMTVMMAAFVALVIVPALDHRFGWSHASVWVVLVGHAAFSIGWLAILRVFRENTFTATTVAIMPGQTVIATGPYAIVRHPMYAGGLFLLAGMPLALGSWWGLVAFAIILPALVWRLLDEERMLTRGLAGYTAYRQMVQYPARSGLVVGKLPRRTLNRPRRAPCRPPRTT